MAEPGKTERWNSLLESLGVPASEPAPPPQPPADADAPATAKPQPVSLLPSQKAKAAPKPKAGPPAAKSPSYWSRIAGALGLDVGATATPPEPEAPKIQRTEEPKAEAIEPPRHEPRRHAEQTPAREREMPARAFERPRREEG